MKSTFFTHSASLLLLATFASAPFAHAELYSHEVLAKLEGKSGHVTLSVRLYPPQAKSGVDSKGVILELPLCERRSVKRVDQYCGTEDGVIGKVTGLTGTRMSFDTPDLSEARLFAEFLASKPTVQSSK